MIKTTKVLMMALDIIQVTWNTRHFKILLRKDGADYRVVVFRPDAKTSSYQIWFESLGQRPIVPILLKDYYTSSFLGTVANRFRKTLRHTLSFANLEDVEKWLQLLSQEQYLTADLINFIIKRMPTSATTNPDEIYRAVSYQQNLLPLDTCLYDIITKQKQGVTSSELKTLVVNYLNTAGFYFSSYQDRMYYYYPDPDYQPGIPFGALCDHDPAAVYHSYYTFLNALRGLLFVRDFPDISLTLLLAYQKIPAEFQLVDSFVIQLLALCQDALNFNNVSLTQLLLSLLATSNKSSPASQTSCTLQTSLLKLLLSWETFCVDPKVQHFLSKITLQQEQLKALSEQPSCHVKGNALLQTKIAQQNLPKEEAKGNPVSFFYDSVGKQGEAQGAPKPIGQEFITSPNNTGI